MSHVSGLKSSGRGKSQDSLLVILTVSVCWLACMKTIQSQLGSSECSGYQTAVLKAGLEAADGDCNHVKEVGKQYFSEAPSSCCPGIRALLAQACQLGSAKACDQGLLLAFNLIFLDCSTCAVNPPPHTFCIGHMVPVWQYIESSPKCYFSAFRMYLHELSAHCLEAAESHLKETGMSRGASVTASLPKRSLP